MTQSAPTLRALRLTGALFASALFAPALSACSPSPAPADAPVTELDGGQLDGGPRDGGPNDGGRGDAARLDGGPPPPPPTGPLGLSDVSTLFPLPSSLATSTLLALDAPGLGGPLLEASRFEQILVFADDAPGGPTSYERFRVVGVRIDPCFPSLALLRDDPSACRRQMRLITQPLREEGGLIAGDSAVHLLFDLTPAQFDAMLEELALLRGDRPFDPHEILGVHPVLAAEDDDRYAALLRAWILRYAGAETLAELTFVRGDENFTWDFGGFLVGDDGALSPLAIGGLDDAGAPATRQQLTVNLGLVSPSPLSALTTSIAPLFGIAAGTRDMPFWVYPAEAEVQAGLESAFRIENPDDVDANRADCASCHLAGPVRMRAESMGHASEGSLRYRSGWDLSLSSVPTVLGRPNRVRAFGYSREGATISQRTVNETAAVADALNAMLTE